MKPNKSVVWLVSLALLIPALCFGVLSLKRSLFETLPYYGDNFQECRKGEANNVASFHFIDQDEHETSDAFTSGKVWVACCFFTTCPSICPKMIAGMGDLQTRFRNNSNFRMVSFTVDPVHDTPKILFEYAKDRSIDTRQWNLVTGAKRDLYRYARKELKLVASDGDGGPADFIHSDRLVLIDQQNYIRGYYDGTEPSEVKQLIRDIDKLLK